MPDTAELEMPGSQSKGVPGWLMVVGAVAGVAGLVLLLKGSGGGGGTTAAGTSINAALGSIQEENMNLLGVTQQGFMETQQGFGSVNAGMTQGFLNTQNQIGGLGTQIGSGFSDTQGLISALEHDLSSQLSGFSNTTQNNFNNLAALTASGQATQAQQNTAMQGLLQSIQGDVQSGLVGQQQANNLIANIEQGVINIASNIPGPWSAYEGKVIAQGTPGGSRTNPSGTWTYYVQGGQLYGIGTGDAFKRLTGATDQQYTSGQSDKFITMISTPDSILRSQMVGTIAA